MGDTSDHGTSTKKMIHKTRYPKGSRLRHRPSIQSMKDLIGTSSYVWDEDVVGNLGVKIGKSHENLTLEEGTN